MIDVNTRAHAIEEPFADAFTRTVKKLDSSDNQELRH